jgi:hypothetical protein
MWLKIDAATAQLFGNEKSLTSQTELCDSEILLSLTLLSHYDYTVECMFKSSSFFSTSEGNFR